MQMDMHQTYLRPPTHHAYFDRLKDVRVLLTRTCQSLSYIEALCSTHGVNLDTVAIDQRRIAERPSDHPFHMISIYLKPGAWTDFNNYAIFMTTDHFTGGVNTYAWDTRTASASEASVSEIVSDWAVSESGSKMSLDSGSGVVETCGGTTTSQDESLPSGGYSAILGGPHKHIAPTNKRDYPPDVEMANIFPTSFGHHQFARHESSLVV